MIDIAAKIRKAGVPVKGSGKAKGPIAEVRCSECGRAIRSDDVAAIGWVRTRRNTDIFFHEGCRKKVGAG